MLLGNLLLLLALLLYLLDLVGKIASGHSIRTAGADLCMFALSFHVGTILINQMTNALLLHPDLHTALESYTISLAFVVMSLIFWLLCLFVTGDQFDTLIEGWASIKVRFVFTIVLGWISIFGAFYVLSMLAV